jgi:hypothetical protein
MTAVIEAEMTAAIHVMTLTSVLDDDLGVLGLGRRGHRHHEPDGGKRRQRENDLAHCGVSLMIPLTRENAQPPWPFRALRI